MYTLEFAGIGRSSQECRHVEPITENAADLHQLAGIGHVGEGPAGVEQGDMRSPGGLCAIGRRAQCADERRDADANRDEY
ncbi:Uncharacterised protein [Mycobacteroides abscessus subsp. abscessus]|nr:Uncharacterised protein [Mycobacteroides abscessus subsp. abscessus]